MARKVEAFDLVCAISEYGRSQLMRFSEPRHWQKLRVVRLGVDCEVFTSAVSIQPSAVSRLCRWGRLAAVKGFEVLIAAVGRLVNEGGTSGCGSQATASRANG